MGYTHFDKVSGINSVAVGAKGSEVDISDSSGNLAQAGTTITATGAEINSVVDGCTATAAEINRVADFSTNVLEVDASTAGTAVTAGVQHLEISTTAGAGAITIADLSAHQGLFSIKQTGASTSGVTVTATAGTWDGTNNIATTDTAKEYILVHIDSAGNGSVVENVGTVGLSS